MPEHLFSILNWHHSKRRNRSSPFTLEAIAKIHTFYKQNSSESPVDTGVIEDTLGDEIRSESDPSYSNVSDDTAEEFQRTMRWVSYSIIPQFLKLNVLHSSEYQEILQSMSQSDVIDGQCVSDDDLICMEKAMNKDDQDLRSVFVEVGLFDRTDVLNVNEEQTAELDQGENDYDVDELLRNALSD